MYLCKIRYCKIIWNGKYNCMLEDFFVVYECVLYYIGYMSCTFLGFRYCSDDCFVIYYFGFMFCLFIMMGNFLF